MELKEAFEIILQLAGDNFCDPREDPEEYLRQETAWDIVSNHRDHLLY